jgi:hypothetical protein
MRRAKKTSLKHVVSLRITDDEREFLDTVKLKTKVSISSVMREAFLQLLSQSAEPSCLPLPASPEKVVPPCRPRNSPLPIRDLL